MIWTGMLPFKHILLLLSNTTRWGCQLVFQHQHTYKRILNIQYTNKHITPAHLPTPFSVFNNMDPQVHFRYQICSCAYFGYRRIHITPQFTFHRSRHLPQALAGFQSLQFMNFTLTFHICIIICTRRRPTLLHAHIQTLNILSTTLPHHMTIPLCDESLLMTSCLLFHWIIITTKLARSFLLTFWNQLNQMVRRDISKKIHEFLDYNIRKAGRWPSSHAMTYGKQDWSARKSRLPIESDIIDLWYLYYNYIMYVYVVQPPAPFLRGLLNVFIM